MTEILFARIGDQAGLVTGAASSVDNDIVLFSGLSGKLVKDSGVTLAAFLLKANNLSDLANPGTAFANLDNGGVNVPNNPFGGDWLSHYNASLVDNASHSGNAKIAFSASTYAVGSGTDGPQNGNYAGFVVAQKQNYLTSTVHGEIDGIYFNTYQGKFGDTAAILGGALKVNGGTGAAIGAELGVSLVNSSGVSQQVTHTIAGLLSVDSSEYVGYNAEAWVGTLTSAFRADTFNSIGTPAWTNVLTARRIRDNSTIYFNIDGSGRVAAFVGTAASPAYGFIGGAGEGMWRPGTSTLGWSINSLAALQLTATELTPAADGGLSLGTAALGWQNLFANTGFVLNVEGGNWVATHTSGILTVGTGDLRVTTAGTNAASVATVGGTQTLTNKTLTSPVFTGPSLGVATATSLAIGGCTIGSNGLCVTGTSAFTGVVTLTAAPVFTDASGSRTALGLGTMATQAASSVAITGGTIAGLTGLAIRDTSAAFDVTIAAVSSTNLSAGRTLTINMVNAARTLKLGANLTLATDPGSITGALKSNGTGTFAAASCSDLSGVGAFCAGTDAANLTGTVASARLTGVYTGITGFGAGTGSSGITINGGNSGASDAAFLSLTNVGVSNLYLGNLSGIIGGGYTTEELMYIPTGGFHLYTGGNEHFSVTSAGLTTVTGSFVSTTTIKTGGYTVATLPAGAVGMTTYVTDADACTFLTTVVHTVGAITCPVFYDGTTWKGG